MLRTRLWMGAILVVMAVGVLVVDQRLGPWYPFLFLLLLFLATVACYELFHLLPTQRRPSFWLSYISVSALLLTNWLVHVWPAAAQLDPDPWHWVLATFVAIVLLAFLAEMATFHEPGESLGRIALTIWMVAYLALLPSFLAQLRWPPVSRSSIGEASGTLSLALTIFVPKCCDIGAYFTGRFLGRHRMSPVLSPKKTWEGAFGGLAAAVVATVAINHLGPVLLRGFITELGFGITVGMAGMLGDLAESLIKRDCQKKDASQVVPGFGGVLDVIDAVLFAAPVAYCWL